MGSYFKSKDVEVYPCSYRGTYIDDKSQTKQLNPKARMLTEDGITRIGGAARLADNYVVNSSETVLEVVLAGYYFKISNLNDNNYSLANCYLNINTLDITTSGEKQRILDSLDSTTEGILDSGEYFTGLSYSLDKEGKVSFKVFDNDGNVLDSAYLPAYDTEFGTFKIHGNSVSGKRSAAFGTGTDTNKENQFVVGSYNETSSSSQFIVGNGTSDNRKNVFETGSGTTLINEDAKVSGKLEVEGALIAKKNITVGEHLVVSGDISGSSKLNIEGAATFSDSLKIGKTDDDYNVKIEKSGQTTLADIAVFNNKGIDLKQDVNADKNVFIAGTCNISGDNEILQLTSSKIISKNSGLTINAITVTEEGDVTAKDITANGTLTAKKTLTVNGTGDSSFKGAVTAKSGKTETPNSTNNHVALLSDLLDLIYPVGSIYTADAKTYDQKESSLVCPIATKLGGT